MKRTIGFVCLAALVCTAVLVGFGSGMCSEEPGLESLEGYWRGVQEDGVWAFVFQFRPGALGEYSGTIHVYESDKKVQEVPIDEVTYKAPEIRLRIEMNNIRYEGKVDAAARAIDGKFKYADGSSLAMVLNLVDPSTLPGLAARTAEAGGVYTYEYRVPDVLGDEWEVSHVQDQAFDSGLIHGLVAGIVAGDYGFLHSLVIVRNGKLVLEEYFYNYDRESPHRLESATKSISSLLVGIARDKGFLKGLDEPILAFFPDRAPRAASGWDEVSLSHILTMTAGAVWEEEDLKGFYGSEDRFETVFSQPVKYVPGQRFEYVSPNVDLLAGVIRHATGKHADDFAGEHLFKPLGITNYDWDRGKWKGYPLMDGSLRLLPRDMAKIGQMVLDGGRWKGRQVISEAWIRESTAPQVDPEGPEEYGYLWWRGTAPFEDRMVKGVYASGRGSQFIFIIPEYNLVVVTTGGNDDNDMNFAPVRMFPQHILPALQ